MPSSRGPAVAQLKLHHTRGHGSLDMVVQPSLPAVRAKWASDLIERLDHSQRGIVRGIKTTVEPQLDVLGDMVLDATGQKRPVDRWLDKLVPGLALGVGLLLLVALTMPRPRSRRPGWRRVWAGRALYALSVVNPFFSVLANDYTFVRDAQRSYVLARGLPVVDNSEKLRQLVTGVGAVKPRRLLVLGGVLRGVQLHSPLRRVFDPPASFGVGINLLALIDGVAWPASLLLGWALSAPWWRLGQVGWGLGAAGGAVRGSLGSTGGTAANGTVTGSAPEHAAHLAAHPGQEPATTHAAAVWSGEAAHPAPRHGLVLTLHLPTEHCAAITVGFMVLNDQMRALRWTLMLILVQTRASFARAGPGK